MRWYKHGYHTPLAHRLVFTIIPRVPKCLHPPIAALTALVFFLLLPDERRALVRNLRRIRGRGQAGLWLDAWRVFYSFCDFMVSYCYVPQADHAALRRMLADPATGMESIERCLQRGHGVIVWTAHLGNWEFASRLLEMYGRPVNVARVVERGKPAEAMLRDLMTNERLRIVQLNDDPLAAVRLLHALRENEIVAMQGDRVYQANCAELAFFGEPARFPLGPFYLSLVSGAPVLPGFVVREGWLRYRVIMGEPIELEHTGKHGQDLEAGVRQAVAFLEDNVRKYATQWLNFYDFWTSAPVGERGPAFARESPVLRHEQKA